MNFWKKRRRDRTKFEITIGDILSEVECKVELKPYGSLVLDFDHAKQIPISTFNKLNDLVMRPVHSGIQSPNLYGELHRLDRYGHGDRSYCVYNKTWYLDDILIKSLYWKWRDATCCDLSALRIEIGYTPMEDTKRIEARDLI